MARRIVAANIGSGSKNEVTPVQLPVSVTDDKDLDSIIALLQRQSGHDFSLYKKNTLLRRIERRKDIHKIDTTANYAAFLEANPQEHQILFKELLIGVTNFFRDTLVWEAFAARILPDLLDELPADYTLRAWVPACSTGEEAYSLAIIFIEAMERVQNFKNLTLRIFATDLSQDSIKKARKGIFSSAVAAHISPERLQRFFIAEGNQYRVNDHVRASVIFAPHNVISDPPFIKLDILICRNLLIYMEPVLQKRLLSLFHYSLNTGGIILLGSAENLGNTSGFEELDARLKFYKSTSIRTLPKLADFPSLFSSPKQTLPTRKTPKVIENIQAITDQVLLQHFSPASVLVNSSGDIVYITGQTGKYLEPAAGKVNWNIHVMGREGLRQALPEAFHKAMQNFEPVYLHRIKVENNGSMGLVDVTVQRIESPESIKGMVIIVFNDVSELPTPGSAIVRQQRGKRTFNIQIQTLEEKLQESYATLQRNQEDMQAAHEELQATNEELQCTNEELTTSREEMQSLNEELQAGNALLQSKLSNFLQADNDLKNLLNNIQIAVLFLDKDLNIRRFTDRITDIFKLRNVDIGRPFTDVVTNMQYPQIYSHAAQVLKTLVPVETDIPTHDGRQLKVRIMPYRTHDDRIDGLVMTFSDR